MKTTEKLAWGVILGAVILAAVYLGLAYEFVPSAWRFAERRHPALDMAGTRSFTSAGIPGDPLNVAFVGTEESLLRLMALAQWLPADLITWKSSLRIAVASAAHRPYLDAPISNLFVHGRKQDLASEQAAGPDPSRRHHVRFWKLEQVDLLNRPLWIGSATYDTSVGLSHTTGQVTHHIAADVDHERDKMVADMQRVGGVSIKWIDDFQPQREGRNGGGDRFFTDGRLALIEEGPIGPGP